MKSATSLDYATVRHRIADGDLLLWRSTSLIGWGISLLTRGYYPHAAMAIWWHNTLMNVGMVGTGGRAVTLSSQVERYPGRIDWFRANPPGRKTNWNAHLTVRRMVRCAGTRYGWWTLFRSILSYSIFTRWLVRPDGNDNSNGHDAVCSQAVASAYRAGGVDPVLLLGDAWTTPNDLAHSRFFEYMGTLT